MAPLLSNDFAFLLRAEALSAHEVCDLDASRASRKCLLGGDTKKRTILVEGGAEERKTTAGPHVGIRILDIEGYV